jgi:ABC-2 type transport system permease protein
MVLSSLFLLWGREAWHLTRLAEEPVYFVSGLNFPVGRLGFLGALAVATIPLAVGLDAMRQLAFAGGVGSFGTPPPEVEALILLAMSALFLVLARVFLRTIERIARHEGRLTSRSE